MMDSSNPTKQNSDKDQNLRIMREISNETCVDVTARLSTEGPQKPDEN